ncbi:hypothetical protein MRX96_051643 [Rhipicephalus microplus]
MRTVALSRPRPHLLRMPRTLPVRELLCDDDAESGHSILTICTNKRRGLYVDVDVSVNNPKPLTHKVSFLIDTGSAVSIIGEGHFPNLFKIKYNSGPQHYSVGLFTPEDSCAWPV